MKQPKATVTLERRELTNNTVCSIADHVENLQLFYHILKVRFRKPPILSTSSKAVKDGKQILPCY